MRTEASPTVEDEASPIGQRMKRRQMDRGRSVVDEVSPMKHRQLQKDEALPTS